jgi:hypothetical protein
MTSPATLRLERLGQRDNFPREVLSPVTAVNRAIAELTEEART